MPETKPNVRRVSIQVNVIVPADVYHIDLLNSFNHVFDKWIKKNGYDHGAVGGLKFYGTALEILNPDKDAFWGCNDYDNSEKMRSKGTPTVE